MPTLATCRSEIEDLHAFFAGWYTGEIDRDAFDRFERALAPDFEMVTPDGSRHDRPAVLDAVRDSYGRDAPGEFDVEIRNVERVAALGEHALVRYEEWQWTPDDETGRVSTALFREDGTAPHGVAWLDLHETWLDD